MADHMSPTDVTGDQPAGHDAGTSDGPLVVIGDSLLDHDLVGKVERISDEAPVPVVDDVEVRCRPGGAGLAAVLAASQARPVVLVTALAEDVPGDELGSLLRQAGVEVVDLGLAGCTPILTRIRTEDRSVLMLSQGYRTRAVHHRGLRCAERDLLGDAAAILVADYGRGLSDEDTVRAALGVATGRLPVVWDPHPSGLRPVPNCRLVTPNEWEARQLAPEVLGDGLAADIARSRSLVTRWSADSVVVTRGGEGAALVGGTPSSPVVVPTTRVLMADPCGAGDFFAAFVTGLLADGVEVAEAVTRAVAASSLFVSSGGVSSITRPIRESIPLTRG
jgi:D-beta-D-heptose 7-phosphate kinase / D-beta-D-heptose 1-phosphate adenosyltransferase